MRRRPRLRPGSSENNRAFFCLGGPRDKSEGYVKTKVSHTVPGTAFCRQRKVEDQGSGNLTPITCGGDLFPKIVPPTIDSATTATMILLCEHPVSTGCESIDKSEGYVKTKVSHTVPGTAFCRQ